MVPLLDLLDEKSCNEELLKMYDQAIEIDPNRAKAHYERGCILEKLDRHKDAIRAFNRAIEIDPNNASFHAHLSINLYILFRFAEALNACDRAIELDPENATAHEARGYILEEINHDKGSDQDFEQSKRIEHDSST